MVTGLEKLGRRVAATTADSARNERAMRGVIARCADVVPPETASITLSEAQHYLGRQIELEIDSVCQSDGAHIRELADLDVLRQERDAAVVELYGTTLRTRRGFETVHGGGSGKRLLGLDTEVPDDPVRLYHTADRCRQWLRDPALVLPEPDLPGFRFDREATAAGLDGPVERLGEVLALLPREEKHAVDTLASKMREMRRLDELIGRTARWLESFYDVADMVEESDRIRQSSHRASQEPAGSDDPAAEDGASPPEAPVPETSSSEVAVAGESPVPADNR